MKTNNVVLLLAAAFMLDQQLDIYYLRRDAKENEAKLEDIQIMLALSECDNGDKVIALEEMNQKLTKACVEVLKANYKKTPVTKKLKANQL
jgi:hypothetical protein